MHVHVVMYPTWFYKSTTMDTVIMQIYMLIIITKYFVTHFRPPGIGGLRLYCDSILYLVSFIFFFCIRQLPCELNERNSTKNGCMFRSECDFKKCMCKIWGAPSL